MMRARKWPKLDALETAAFVVFSAVIVTAVFAPLLAPYNPYDLADIDVLDSLRPPAWLPGGTREHLLGADDQGRDLLSLMIYGARTSLAIGVSSAVVSALIGVTLGLAAAWFGGVVDAVIMRVADVKMSFPAILIALLIDGISRIVIGSSHRFDVAAGVLILAISLSHWVQFARTVRASAMVEARKEYVQAAIVLGLRSPLIVLRHILPNVIGPVLVIGTLNLGLAIISEATLSFLGVGLPPSQPSLGTLVRIGEGFFFSGEWWITLFPAALLAAMVTSVNVLGDTLRSAFNPRNE